MTLNGKRIVVLAGSSGIGLATAQAAAQEGANVVIASSHRARIDEALTMLPVGAEGHVLDLADSDAALSCSHGLAPSIIWSSRRARRCSSRHWRRQTLVRRAASSRCAIGRLLRGQIWQQQHSERRLDRVHFWRRGTTSAPGLVARCKRLRSNGGTDMRTGSRACARPRQHRLAWRGANVTVGEHGGSRARSAVSTGVGQAAGRSRWRRGGDRASVSLPNAANLQHRPGPRRGRWRGSGRSFDARHDLKT